jgi:hypothetical protein
MFVEFFAGETLVGFSAADERLNIPAGGTKNRRFRRVIPDTLPQCSLLKKGRNQDQDWSRHRDRPHPLLRAQLEESWDCKKHRALWRKTRPGRVCPERMRMWASWNAGDMGCICCPGLKPLGSEWSGNVRVQRGRLLFVWRRMSRLFSSRLVRPNSTVEWDAACCGTYHETRIRTSVCKLAPQPYAVSHTLVEPSLTVSI